MEDNKTKIINNKIKIKIVGVGGAGNNIIDDFEIQDSQLENVKLFLVNTDAKHLDSKSHAKAEKFAFGKDITSGNGTGSDPEKGRQAFKEDKEYFDKAFEDADIVFTVFGLGKGTGSGAGPEIARLAKEKGALSICLIVLPFSQMGGKKQNDIASNELSTINEKCDSYLLYSNDSILKFEGSESSIINNEICRSIQTVIDIIFLPAIINLDFADIKSRLSNGGLTIIGMGNGSGDDKESEAVRKAVESPFIEGSIQGAKNILVHLVCQKKNNIKTLENVTNAIKLAALSTDDVDNVFGLTENDDLSDEIFIRVIVNGLPLENQFKSIKKSKTKVKAKVSKISNKGLLKSDLLESEVDDANLYSHTKEEEIKEINSDEDYEEDLF